MDATQVSDWEAYLKGAAPCRFPNLGRRPAGTGGQQHHSVRVEVEQAAELFALASSDPEKFAAVLRTAWAVFLRCYTGQDDVSFGFQLGDHDARDPVIARFLLDDGEPVARTVDRTRAQLAGQLPPVPSGLLPSSNPDRSISDTAVVLWGFTEGSTPSPVLAPIRLLAKRGDADLGLFLEWNSSLLGMSPALGALVASTLGQILSGIPISAPGTPLGSLECVSQTHLDRIHAWNEASEIDPVERCVHDVIADRVRERPDEEAVCAWDGSFTFRDLDAVASVLAARLVTLGVGPEVFVPLCFEKSGTIIEHRAYCSGARRHAPAMGYDGTRRTLQFAAHTFDASICEIVTTLMVGGCVCVPSEHERLNDLAGAMNRMRVNLATLTPSFVNFLTPAAVPRLQRLVLAGEAMSRSHVATWSHLELVNGYGPAESSVASLVNSKVGPDTEPTDIGFPCGVRVWLVDPADHDRLVPIGCVGEMLLEGPSLARGYLNDPVKTGESFILDPKWASSEDGSPRRFYKTGDLARYNSEFGSFSYVGRKDTQIKLHGQRIELGEVEHHLAVDENVQHALVLLPKKGPLANRLVTVLSLLNPSSPASENTTSGDGSLKLAENLSLADPVLESIRSRISDRLPAYMVPAVWLCVEAIPMLPSGKMDRKKVSTWVETILTAKQCQSIIKKQHASNNKPASVNGNAGNTSNAHALSEVESQLRDIWSLVLNFPADQIEPDDRSFLSLGGDSISAMACASHAKKVHLNVSVQDVLKAKSLRQLAAAAKPMSRGAENGNRADAGVLDVPFELTPIQQLHFEVRGGAHGDEHFNQSFLLRLARRVEVSAVRNAIQVVVDHHAMLRARFARRDNGRWKQFITADVEGSYRLRTHMISTRDDADAGIASAQGCLDARRGPLFAAELFTFEDSGEQMLFMTVHHLVVDLVSWRVLLEEIEELIQNPSTPLVHESISFREWAALQIEDCAEKSLSQVLPSADQVPDAQFTYWGMHNQPNLYGDVECHGFDLDAATSATLLNECHVPFGTETVDLLLAALIWSFQGTFTDRAPPAVFNEGHGREPPHEDIDIARTVGWFTTLFPIALSSPANFADALAQVKDIRRRVPANGRAYFAARFHTPEGREKWASRHKNMEISFNFHGRYQQLERKDALFQPAEGALMAGEAHPGSSTADFGTRAPRFALFEISAVIVQGALRFGFAWNGGMKHQDRIREWVANCRAVLAEAAGTLPKLGRTITASDLVLLPKVTLSDLRTFEQTKLPGLVGERGWDAIEDVYPASPIQQGLLLSRTKDGAFYAVRRTFQLKLSGSDAGCVNAQRVVDAWKQVVRHHALLRTVFVDAISQAEAGSYDQVVLKDVEPTVVVRECISEAEVRTLADRVEPMHYDDKLPQHRLSVFYSGNTVACVMELSHAIMDGASMDILLRDLGRAYEGSLEQLPKPLFSPFVAKLQRRNLEVDVAFWKDYLSGIEPCHFPVLNDGLDMPEGKRVLRTLRVEVPELAALHDFCTRTGFTLPNALHVAWALTLSCYTGSDDVCFGSLVSGRDASLEGSQDAVGPFINMATQRVKLGGDGDDQPSLMRLLESVQRDQLDCNPYAQTSLAEVQHALNMPGGMALFNTCISYRRLEPKPKASNGSLLCEDIAAIHDPTEYPISLNVEIGHDGKAAIDLDYWTDSVSSGQARHVTATFIQALHNLVENAEVPISQLDNVHPSTKEDIWSWNAQMPATTVDCMHRMVEKQVALRSNSQAIRGWDGDFTYEEMNNLANRLAKHLVSLGVGPEILVPVCFDKSSLTTISMLAVLKAGGGVVPLDATHPASALEEKVTDTGARVVVASEARAVLFNAMAPHVVAVGPAMLAQLPSLSDNEEVLSGVTPENPAFVMFTSGSTGKPKGVVLCHQALVSSCLAHGAALGIGPHTRFLQFATHTFDNSIEEMFTTLIHGGCVCVPSEEDRLGNLPGAISNLDANFMDLTPTVAAMLRPEQVPSICGLAVGGEALTREVLDIWGGAVPVHNQYGPSECSINAAHKLHLDRDGDIGNIGTSVGSVSWVVDPKDHDRLVPVGCVDTQVKLHGQRIELGEIEHHVKTILLPTAQSSVELITPGRSKKALAVFICLSPNRTEEPRILPMNPEFSSYAQTMVATLRGKLASYMVPSLFLPVSRMPLTSSGKLDRRRLRTMAQELSSSVAEFRLGAEAGGGRAPETPMEKQLQELWASVLNLPMESITADEDFFTQGGDSVGAMRLAAAARQRGIVLAVSSIFQSPKLSEMAERATWRDTGAAATNGGVCARNTAAEESVPASDAFWIEKLSAPGAAHFPQLPHPGHRVQATSQVTRSVRFTKTKGSSLTMSSFLRAAWGLVVSIYASSDDVVFGEILNGRDIPVAGIADMIGPTLASIPRRVRIDRAMSVQQLLVDMQKQLNDVVPHQFSGLQRIRTLGPAVAAACDFKNLLAIDMADEVPESGLWSEMTGGGTAQGSDFFNLPLNVTCTFGRGGNGVEEIQMRAIFDADVVPQWQAVRMLAQFDWLLSCLSAPQYQGVKVGDIELLTPEDKATLRGWNQVPGPLVEKLIHELIGDQMARRGTSEPVVVGWDATLSAGELDAFSTALAVELERLKALERTSRPVLSHTAFCSGAAAHGPAMLMTPPFRFLQFASYTFDASLVEILTTLMFGGTVCVPRDEDRTNGNIASVMEQMGVTMALLTPSFARVLEPASVPHLKTLILGGEAMSQSHLETWAEKVNLVNAYGPSECAVVATVNSRMRPWSSPANLGRGLGRCWIVDPENHDRLAPIGSVGELLVEGPTLSNGYLKNEVKTREVFIENPKWALDDATRYPDMRPAAPRRMYKTGDLVRICDDFLGNWRQRITSDVAGSYRFKTHVIGNASRMDKRIQNSQSSLDFQKGPLLAADWFAIGKSNKEVYVFIAIHHLVVDVVSWGVLLQDLEDFLATGAMKPAASLSFQTWTRKQSELAQMEKNGSTLLPHHEASTVDLEYWGMANLPNVHDDAVPTGDIELDYDTTASLLAPKCHAPLETDVLDVLLAALLLSFRNATGGRKGVPTIYNEGHGREGWDDTIDLSRTVGWFTTLYPVHLPDEASSDDDILAAIRWIKDYRQRLPGKGRPYFAYRMLTSEGREEYDLGWPVEVVFNYLGQMQQMSRTDTFLQPLEDGIGQGVNTSSDIGKDPF
ncbi:hypothetical protein VTH06DRAFT_4898 [Thermothelomyces fergusii]